MKVDNVKSQMRKGMLEYCIMLLLHKEPAYASDIIQKLKEAQLIVVEGTLYPLLTRLKNDDLFSFSYFLGKQFGNTHLNIVYDLFRTLLFTKVMLQIRQIII